MDRARCDHEPGQSARDRHRSIDGRCVRTLADREFDAGYTGLSWDGRTTGGSLAPNGIYFAHFEAEGGAKVTKRLVLSR